MKTTRLARRLGLDGNPLRRRTDKIAARLAALLLALFAIGAPVLSVAAVGWAGRAAAAGQQATSSWRQVPAVLLRAAPDPAAGGVFGYSRAWARWIAPDGQVRAGAILVGAGLAAGRTVRLWVNAAGWPAGPAPDRGAVVAREAVAAAVAAAVLGIALLGLAWAGRWVLDRRRLASWEAAWAAVGPHWTRRFRSPGYPQRPAPHRQLVPRLATSPSR